MMEKNLSFLTVDFKKVVCDPFFSLTSSWQTEMEVGGIVIGK